MLRITAGTPTDEELAAVLAVLTSLSGGATRASVQAEPSGWIDRARAVNAPPRPGPGAWLASVRPTP